MSHHSAHILHVAPGIDVFGHGQITNCRTSFNPKLKAVDNHGLKWMTRGQLCRKWQRKQTVEMIKGESNVSLPNEKSSANQGGPSGYDIQSDAAYDDFRPAHNSKVIEAKAISAKKGIVIKPSQLIYSPLQGTPSVHGDTWENAGTFWIR